ncbi:N-acetyltransferase family protein [Pseudarthrobacter sp. O4]|uniref:GNAT family N-acetyltransferase n=1 Tax=Pseudarthrobacter sp. O4 TaxID=3418417 RepID=UPI003CFA9F16
MANELSIRPAVPDDARSIALVHIQAWRESYAHLLPADILAGLDHGAREKMWRTLIAAGTPDVWVASDGAEIIGWASASAGRDADAPRPLELEGIYVLASHYGSGAGQSLLDTAAGGRPAYLWVAADNPRAFAFYRRNGFVPDGATTTAELAGVPVRIMRMVR